MTATAARPVRIGIAVVRHGRKYLVGERSNDQPLEGRAEFPGGKCLAGEDSRACAERECLEESGLAVTAREQIIRTEFDYPHGMLDLTFWLCEVALEDDVRQSHLGFAWVDEADLAKLHFPSANQPVIRLLTGQGGFGFT